MPVRRSTHLARLRHAPLRARPQLADLEVTLFDPHRRDDDPARQEAGARLDILQRRSVPAPADSHGDPSDRRGRRILSSLSRLATMDTMRRRINRSVSALWWFRRARDLAQPRARVHQVALPAGPPAVRTHPEPQRADDGHAQPRSGQLEELDHGAAFRSSSVSRLRDSQVHIIAFQQRLPRYHCRRLRLVTEHELNTEVRLLVEQPQHWQQVGQNLMRMLRHVVVVLLKRPADSAPTTKPTSTIRGSLGWLVDSASTWRYRANDDRTRVRMESDTVVGRRIRMGG